MAVKTKRTYNLSTEIVQMVQNLVSQGVGRSQDAVVELAVSELGRKQRETAEAAIWREAAADPIFQEEIGRIQAAFASADAETWPGE